MINMKNITPEMKEQCGEDSRRFLDTVRFSAVELIRSIMNELPPEAVLVSANMINACRRDDPKECISFTPETFIRYTLNDYVVYIEFGHFWMFEGVMIDAYPIKNGVYQSDKYGMYFPVDRKEGILELIELAKNPKAVYDMMDFIVPVSKSDSDYVNAKRKVETAIYIK